MNFTEKEFRYLIVALLWAIWQHASFWGFFIAFCTLPMIEGALNGLYKKWSAKDPSRQPSPSSPALR